MTGGTLHPLPTQSGDGSHLIAAGPLMLGIDASDRFAFAIIGATSEDQIRRATIAARARYAAMRTSLAVDFLPGQCPNVLSLTDVQELDRPRTASALPPTPVVELAVLGQDDFDPTAMNPVDVTLLGHAASRWRIADVGTPLRTRESGDCECPIAYPDGRDDLILAYNRADIVAALGVAPGDHVLPVRAVDESKAIRIGQACVTISEEPIRYPSPAKSTQDLQLRVSGPNPFNASTEFEMIVPCAGHARLEVFDVLGQRVATLIDDDFSEGSHYIPWDARDSKGRAVASGVYFARASICGSALTQKLVLLK